VSEWAGPCPVCGGTDRFSVNTRRQIWNCRGCAKGGNVIGLAQHAGGATFAQAVAALNGDALADIRSLPPRTCKLDPDEDGDLNSRLALRIWDAARSIRGTLAERYLVHIRNIDIDQFIELDDVLRFAPDCRFDGDRLPCLVALVGDIVTDAPKAIQRTALNGDGGKIGRRSLGPTKSGVIKLWEDAEVTYGLAIGEGMETVAAAATRINHRGTLLQPAWALIDSANLSGFPVLAGIEALTILVDHDANGVGQAAAASCAKRWSAAGRNVIRLTPDALGTDFNDLALNGGGAG
jgi:Toprim domain/CHC2 zinc finger